MKKYIMVLSIVLALVFGMTNICRFSASKEVEDAQNSFNSELKSSSSVIVWNETWGGADFDSGNGVAVDGSGNVYITGDTSSFGAGPGNAFLVKYAPSGNQLWNETWGGVDGAGGKGVAVDGSGNPYIVTYRHANASLVKYGPSGNQLWNETWGGADGDYGFCVAVDGPGNAYIVGETYSFGTGNTTTAFLVKYDPSGNQLWNETWGGADDDSGKGVAVDGSGNVYITGETYSFGGNNAFLVKYDPSGNQLWNETWSGAASGNDVAVDSSGNAYVAGYTSDAFLVKFDPSGNQLWNETWGGADGDRGSCVVVDGSGNPYVAGHTSSFGAGMDDAFLVKYDPSGNQLWNETWGGTDTDRGFDVAVDGSGNAYVAGYTYSFGAGWADAFLVKYEKDMPVIIINSPIDNQLFGTNAPTFDFTISGASVSATWYTIDDGLMNYTFVGTSGTIDQTAWDIRPNGTVTIRFYANDTLGYLNYNEVTVRKDISAPIIIMNSLTPNQLFGSSAPTFDLTIAENNLDTTWYTIDGGLTNYTFVGTSGTIDQTAWDAQPNGTVTIRFYANDTLGNLDFNEVTVRKDISAPIITINSPIDNQLFGTNAPTFDLTISGANVDATWYTIDGGLMNYTFVGTNGTINQGAWNAQSNGTVTIRFYANNTLGNLDSNEVTVRKNIFGPIITINSPIDNQLFGTNAPTFGLTISGANMDATWYNIDGGLTNYTFTGTSGTFNQVAWDALSNGTVTIRFYANDTLGNLGFNEVTVRKDISAPIIIMNSLTPNQLFGSSAPTFDLTIVEGDLDTTWYTIDGGLTNYTFVGTSGTIDQTAWDTRLNGTVTIRFYANDTLGNLDFNEVTVRKDISAPIITINSPIDNQLFGTNAPTFDLTIVEGDLDITWYTIDGGLMNYTFVGTSGTIHQTAWDAQPNGTVTIRFYANDTLGNLDFNEITVRKDISAPIITINSPIDNQLFSINAPTFDLTISGANVDATWYTIDGGLTNYMFVGTSGTINQTAWDNLNDGQVTIKFYANDTFGRIGFQEVTIRKDVNAPIITINNPQDSDVIGATAPNFDISIVESNLDKTWYSLNGGANITFTGLTGTINQALWDALPEGNVIIRFYANDTFGRIGFQEVTVVKAISQPNPHGIPGYDILLLLGITSTIAVIIVKKRLNHLN